MEQLLELQRLLEWLLVLPGLLEWLLEWLLVPLPVVPALAEPLSRCSACLLCFIRLLIRRRRTRACSKPANGRRFFTATPSGVHRQQCHLVLLSVSSPCLRCAVLCGCCLPSGPRLVQLIMPCLQLLSVRLVLHLCFGIRGTHGCPQRFYPSTRWTMRYPRTAHWQGMATPLKETE